MQPLEVVREARRVNGTVMAVAEHDVDVWGVAVGSVDGAVELRTGNGDAAVLRRLGFVPVIDAWARPASTESDEACAGLLAEAIGSDAPMRHELTYPGVRAAPEHAFAEALRALALRGRDRVDFQGGRPARLLAIVWAVAGGLLVEREVAGDEDVAGDTWQVPLTLDGAAAAARELMARIEAERPGFLGDPLFAEFVPSAP